MKEIIEIFPQQLSNYVHNCVDARELHERLESKRKFADWVQDRLEDFSEGSDFLLHKIVKQKEGAGGHNRVDYILTLDTAKHIAMLERNDVGKKIRQYFIEIEKKQGFPWNRELII